MNYQINKERAKYRNDEPSLTDQSQAAGTDINIVMTQFLRTGQQNGTKAPMFGDFSELPEDLRGFIEMGRSITEHREQLPEQLRNVPTARLFNMTREEISAILNPPPKADDKPNEEPPK